MFINVFFVAESHEEAPKVSERVSPGVSRKHYLDCPEQIRKTESEEVLLDFSNCFHTVHAKL